MATVCQFVDSIGASPTVRCDLNSYAGGLMIGDEGLDLSPPELRTSVASTQLTDGDRVVATSYANRVVGAPLRVIAGSADAAASTLQTLARELDRRTNILKVQLAGMTSPVFFRTFRASDYTLAIVRNLLAHNTSAELAIPAEPFALGLLEAVGAATVNNDPAAGSNQKFMDITGVKGDVETPLIISLPGTTVDALQSLFAVRRGGTPSAMPYIQQAEAATMGTDTATAAFSANYSGGGGVSNNNTVTTFATVTTLAQRLSFLWPPGTAAADMRGTYRVFARLSSGTIGTTTQAFTVQLRYGQRAIVNKEVVLTNAFVTRSMIDLDLIQIPLGMDPETDGSSGAPLKVSPSQITVRLYASRTSGSGTLVVDYLMFVPADDRLCIATWGAAATPSAVTYVLDGTKQMIYGVDASNQVLDIGQANYVGDVPTVSPGVTNRLFYVKDVTPRVGTAAATPDDPAGNAVLTCRYYPRYLTVRPATT